MKRLPDNKRRTVVLATRFSPDEITDLESVAALKNVAETTTFVRETMMKFARSALRKAGKVPVTG